MSLDYQGVPDWCGEAANRQRLEAWYAAFGPGGLPCAVCDLAKLRSDFRRLAQHVAQGKQQVTVKPAAPGARREWSLSLLSTPAALVDGEPSQRLEIVDLRLTCTRCRHVVQFDAKAIGIAV